MHNLSIVCFEKSGGPLTKRISLTATGEVKSDGSACTMPEGIARRVCFQDIAEFGEFIGRLASNQAIALGSLRSDLPDQVKVITKRRMNGQTRPDIIARTNSNIAYSRGTPALALLDFDAKGMPPEVADRLNQVGGFWPALLSMMPALEGAAKVTRPSTSAGLVRADTGERLSGSGGQHGYVVAMSGGDIGRFLRALHDRCWLCGYGWMMVGTAGQFLERSIIDCSVGAPKRLVFEGAPVLEPLVASTLPASSATRHVVMLFDERLEFPGLASLEAEFVRTLTSNSPDRIETYREPMDLSRFDSDAYQTLLKDFLRDKYASKKVDVAVAVFGPALEFLLKFGDTIFPGTPIVFCGVEKEERGDRSLPPHVRGVLLEREFAPTLELALGLHPRTQRVVIVAGTSIPGFSNWRDKNLGAMKTG